MNDDNAILKEPTPIGLAREAKLEELNARLDTITDTQIGMCLKLLGKHWPITGEEFMGFSANHRNEYVRLEREADRLCEQIRQLDPNPQPPLLYDKESGEHYILIEDYEK